MTEAAATLAGYTYRFDPATSDDAPVLLLLHGTGGDERQLWGLGRLLAADAALLAPRGDVVEADGMPRYFRRIPTWDGSAYPFTFDDEDVSSQAERLVAFVETATAHHGVGGRPIVAVGFSNGANIAAAMMLVRPDMLRGGVLLAPMPVLSSPPSADLSRTAVLLGGGRADPIATPAHVESLASTLADRGAAVEVRWHDGGHDIGRPTVEAAREWLLKLRGATGIDPLP